MTPWPKPGASCWSRYWISSATAAPSPGNRTKEDGYIDWDRPAAEVHARIRGVTPWPGARLQARFDGQDELLPLLLQPGRVDEPCDGVRPGSLRTDKKGLCVACADRWYRLLVVRPQGRKDMEAAAFVNGHLRPARHGVCGMAVPFGEYMDRKERGKAAPDGAAFLLGRFTYPKFIEIVKRIDIYIIIRDICEALVINKKYTSSSLRCIPILRRTR